MIGRTFRTGGESYQIIGVVQEPFTGTDTGIMTDIFVPTMMVKNNGIARSDYQWFRTFVMVHPGVPIGPLRDRLDATFHTYLQERAKTFPSAYQAEREAYLQQKLLMNPATAGVSNLQTEYGRALGVLGILVGLVLVIACTNVANLMAVRAVARSQEMALRISIGAGKWRLLQLSGGKRSACVRGRGRRRVLCLVVGAIRASHDQFTACSNTTCPSARLAVTWILDSYRIRRRNCAEHTCGVASLWPESIKCSKRRCCAAIWTDRVFPDCRSDRVLFSCVFTGCLVRFHLRAVNAPANGVLF